MPSVRRFMRHGCLLAVPEAGASLLGAEEWLKLSIHVIFFL
jgi:hypothetical protein